MTFPPLDFDDHHRRILPAQLVTASGRAAARDVRGVSSLAFRLPDGRAYRFVPDDTLRIEPGDDAATVVALDERAWRDFAHEVATTAGLFYGGRLHFVCGGSSAATRSRGSSA